VNVALAFGCIGEARKLWRLVPDQAKLRGSLWVVACGGLAAFLPVLDCMQAGQLGIGILYFLLAGLRLAIEGRAWPASFVAGLVLALPAAVKLVPSLPVAFLLFQRWSGVAFAAGGRRPWRGATALTAGILTGAFIFLLAIPASLIGWKANLTYLRVWHARVVANDRIGPSANFNIHSERNQSLTNAVYLLTKSTAGATSTNARSKAQPDRPERMVHRGVLIVIGLILALLLAAGLALRRRTDPLAEATAYSLGIHATLLVSPLSWGHYYMAAAPAVVCVPLWLTLRGMPRLARVVAVVPPILTWSHYVAMPYLGAVGLLGLGTTAWFLGASSLVVGIEAFAALGQSRFNFVPGTIVVSSPARRLRRELARR
jgi:hypothetical protein